MSSASAQVTFVLPHKPRQTHRRAGRRRRPFATCGDSQVKTSWQAAYKAPIRMKSLEPSHLWWRRVRDSNPRCPQRHNGFRDRPVRPLRQLSYRSSCDGGECISLRRTVQAHLPASQGQGPKTSSPGAPFSPSSRILSCMSGSVLAGNTHPLAMAMRCARARSFATSRSE